MIFLLDKLQRDSTNNSIKSKKNVNRKNDTIYIVSSLVASREKWKDVFFPGTSHKDGCRWDDAGWIVGGPRLIRNV